VRNPANVAKHSWFGWVAGIAGYCHSFASPSKQIPQIEPKDMPGHKKPAKDSLIPPSRVVLRQQQELNRQRPETSQPSTHLSDFPYYFFKSKIQSPSTFQHDLSPIGILMTSMFLVYRDI
jgi:hypothetical protein